VKVYHLIEGPDYREDLGAYFLLVLGEQDDDGQLEELELFFSDFELAYKICNHLKTTIEPLTDKEFKRFQDELDEPLNLGDHYDA